MIYQYIVVITAPPPAMYVCACAFCAGCILFHHQQCGCESVSLSTSLRAVYMFMVYPFPLLAVWTCRVCSSTLKTACQGMVYPSLPPSCSMDVSVYPYHSQQCGHEYEFISSSVGMQGVSILSASSVQCGMQGVSLSTVSNLDLVSFPFASAPVWFSFDMRKI